MTLAIPLPLQLNARRDPMWAARRIIVFLSNLAQRGGALLRTTLGPYHMTDDCGHGSPAPCGCAWPAGLAAIYTVSGWGGLAPCPTCDADASPAWSGALNHIGSGCVWWAANAAFDPLSINGHSLDITYTQILLRTTSPCRWELYIACGSAINPTKTMWAGYKLGGSTPAGTYARVSSDCGNTTSTMTVT